MDACEQYSSPIPENCGKLQQSIKKSRNVCLKAQKTRILVDCLLHADSMDRFN